MDEASTDDDFAKHFLDLSQFGGLGEDPVYRQPVLRGAREWPLDRWTDAPATLLSTSPPIGEAYDCSKTQRHSPCTITCYGNCVRRPSSNWASTVEAQ